jgi:RluA family pseudouridine synthase
LFDQRWILHEDAALIALQKPAGLACVPERNREVPCLLQMLEAYWKTKAYIVHRIDKETTGAIVFARTPEAHRALSMLFEQGQVEKVYRLKAHGLLPARGGTINAPLREFGSGRMGVDSERGKPSRTRYRVLEYDRGAEQTLVEAELLTGRRHQLRAHFHHLGHAIVGDLRYGKQPSGASSALLLHALCIGFSWQEQTYRFEAAPPEALRTLAERSAEKAKAEERSPVQPG